MKEKRRQLKIELNGQIVDPKNEIDLRWSNVQEKALEDITKASLKESLQ